MAPWSTVQLLRYDNLKIARGPDGNRGASIRKKNEETDQAFGPEDKMNMLKQCHNAGLSETGSSTTPKVIRLTRPLPQHDIDRLVEEGNTVELVAQQEQELNVREANLGKRAGKKKKK